MGSCSRQKEKKLSPSNVDLDFVYDVVLYRSIVVRCKHMKQSQPTLRVGTLPSSCGCSSLFVWGLFSLRVGADLFVWHLLGHFFTGTSSWSPLRRTSSCGSPSWHGSPLGTSLKSAHWCRGLSVSLDTQNSPSFFRFFGTIILALEWFALWLLQR